MDYQDILTIQNIIKSLTPLKIGAKTITESEHPKPECIVPVYQALKIKPTWTEAKATKNSHIITYRDSNLRGTLLSCFEFKPVPGLFWTGIRASWTRNVPAFFRITVLSDTTDMKYELYEFQELRVNEWFYLPSVIPALDLEGYRLFLEIRVPTESLTDNYGCDLVVRMVGFEDLIEIGDSQCILKSTNGCYNIGVYYIENKEYGRLYLSVCDGLPAIHPNSTTLPILPNLSVAV